MCACDKKINAPLSENFTSQLNKNGLESKKIARRLAFFDLSRFETLNLRKITNAYNQKKLEVGRGV